MSFLAPWFLAFGAAAAAAAVVLHFLARQRPRPSPLPTARFVPDQLVRAPSLSRRPADLALLALRVLALLALAGAFAGPVIAARRRPIARVVAVDRSSSVGSVGAARDSALALVGDDDRLVLFDTAAHVIATQPRDSLAGLTKTEAPGSLSAGLVAAMRTASSLREAVDSVELVLISPMARGEWDAATVRIRAAWPGRIRLVQVPGVGDSAAAQRVDVRGPLDDPVRAAAALYGAQARTASRVVRGPLTADDSSWAREPGHVLLWWPVSGDGLARRAPEDSSGAVVTENAVLVAPFSRNANPPAGRVVARWADGRPAATEQSLGAGCERSVAIVLPVAGDVALRESTRGVLADLVAPCGGAAQRQHAAAALVDTLRGPGRLAATRELDARSDHRRSPLSTWLFGAAAAYLLAESAVRRRAGQPA